MVTTYMLIFGGALVFVIGVTPIMRQLAPRLGLVDQPSSRKLHVSPTPLMGGVAMYGGIILVLLVFQENFRVDQLASILIGATWMSFLGVWDDRWGITPLLKLAGQIAGALFLVLTGIQVDFLPYQALDVLVTVVWVVGITNAVNLLDNMDGLSGGIVATAAAYFLLMAIMSGQYLVGALAAALLGGCLGFLIYNFNPASIFMGDTGSLFLGFLLAALAIKLRFPDNFAVVTWMVPVMALGVPILDTSLVFVSRLRRGKNPLTTPGKDHLSHRLVGIGLTQKEAVLLALRGGRSLWAARCGADSHQRTRGLRDWPDRVPDLCLDNLSAREAHRFSSDRPRPAHPSRRGYRSATVRRDHVDAGGARRYIKWKGKECQ